MCVQMLPTMCAVLVCWFVLALFVVADLNVSSAFLPITCTYKFYINMEKLSLMLFSFLFMDFHVHGSDGRSTTLVQPTTGQSQ